MRKPSKVGATTPRPKQRGMYKPDQPAFSNRNDASVSSQMHDSSQPPTASSALRRRSPIVPTYGIEPRSLRYEGQDYDEALLVISFD